MPRKAKAKSDSDIFLDEGIEEVIVPEEKEEVIPDVSQPVIELKPEEEWVTVEDWKSIPRYKTVRVTFQGNVVENYGRMQPSGYPFLLIRTTAGPKQIFPDNETCIIQVKR